MGHRGTLKYLGSGKKRKSPFLPEQIVGRGDKSNVRGDKRRQDVNYMVLHLSVLREESQGSCGKKSQGQGHFVCLVGWFFNSLLGLWDQTALQPALRQT